MKIIDLLNDINKYKRTFQNFSRVFKIDYSPFYILKDNEKFSDNTHIKIELYDYFNRNIEFVNNFYADWHKKKTANELFYECGLPVDIVLDLINSKKIHMNRTLPPFKILADTKFRYYSRYELMEKIYNIEVIERPKTNNGI
jgi:hypothetical protein